MQHVEATSGASRAAQGYTWTLAAGRQTAHDVVRESNMDGERDLSEPRGQQLIHLHRLIRSGCLLGQLRQESRGVAAESAKFRDCKGNEAYVGATTHPL
jgi:hypothetical protein